mgnify:FL=1|jgi:hypothetical protein
MRFTEFKKGISVAITNEEQEILEKIRDQGDISKKKLSEREQVIANQLVVKNMVVRKKINDDITYRKTSSPNYF